MRLVIAVFFSLIATQAFAAFGIFILNGAATPSSPQVPGPSAALYASNPNYTCTSNKFVSATGSSGNTGNSSGSPWDMVTAAAYSAPAGTCINLAAGSYNMSTNIITLTHGGTGSTASGYVVWRCSVMPFSFVSGALTGEGTGCVLQNPSAGASFVWTVNASWMMFEGIEFLGGPGAGTAFSAFNIQDDSLLHHIWLMNCDVHGGGLSGFQLNGSDYIFVLHNVMHDNSFSTGSGFFGSGLSIYDPVAWTAYTPTPGNPDYWHSTTTGFTYSVVVGFNVTYHNYNVQSGTANSDGTGIELDNWNHDQNTCPVATGWTCPTTANALIMGNVIFLNGGQGFKNNSVSPGHVTVVNNTSYANSWDTHNTATFRGDFDSEDTARTTNINNLALSANPPAGNTNNPFLGQCESDPNCTGNVWLTNMSYPGGLNNFGSPDSYPTTGTNHNVDGTNPLFTSLDATHCVAGAAATSCHPNLSLQGTSTAIGFGQAFDLWQQSGTVDAGACVSSLTSCP